MSQLYRELERSGSITEVRRRFLTVVAATPIQKPKTFVSQTATKFKKCGTGIILLSVCVFFGRMWTREKLWRF